MDKITLDYSYGELENEPGSIGIRITGSGIDLSKEEHIKQMESIIKTMGTMMYAIAHDIPFDKIEF